MMLRLAVLLITAMMGQGCYYDVESTERKIGSAGQGPHAEQPCKVNYTTGCVQGFLPEGSGLFVNQVRFEDANDLNDRFDLLVKVKGEDGLALTADEVQLAVEPAIDNRRFANGFSAYLKGIETRSAEVLSNGKFSFHNLMPGTYELRVVKRLRFVAQRRVAGKAVKDGYDETKKVLCASLVGETVVDVLSGVAEPVVFDDYRMYWRDRDCADDVFSGNITTL